MLSLFFGRQHKKDIYLNLNPFRGNNNINNYIFLQLLINMYYYYYYYYYYNYYYYTSNTSIYHRVYIVDNELSAGNCGNICTCLHYLMYV